MAHPKEDQIVAANSNVLPTSRIRELARDLGVVMRQRKVDVVCLVQALVLGFRVDRVRSVSGFPDAIS
jgi:hypothetical protein